MKYHPKTDIHMKSDCYFNDKNMVKDYENMGCDVVPVDSFGGYVASNKDSDSDLEETQETIQNRFQLNK